ncbi:MAG: hypothetical protein ACT4O1_06150 [Gemmatimonadota bacterium]
MDYFNQRFESEDTHQHLAVEAQGLDIKKLTKSLSGQRVSHVTYVDSGSVAVHFESGAILVVARDGDNLDLTLREMPQPVRREDAGSRPTRRQREYLEFIVKYMIRFGVAPAESDIERHFLVSAPSVHAMIKTLERRRFITRRRDIFTGQAIPRSIRVMVDV